MPLFVDPVLSSCHLNESSCLPKNIIQSISLFNISFFFSPFHCVAPFPCALVYWAVDPPGFPQKFSNARLLVSVWLCFGVSLLPWLDNSNLQTQCGSKHHVDQLQITGIPSNTICCAPLRLWAKCTARSYWFENAGQTLSPAGIGLLVLESADHSSRCPAFLEKSALKMALKGCLRPHQLIFLCQPLWVKIYTVYVYLVYAVR